MRILGICHDVLICSACVLVDGEVVAAIPEERLDRVKQSRVFPTRAIQECLRIAGLELGDIDEIAVAWNPAREAETTPSGYLDARRWRSSTSSRCRRGCWRCPATQRRARPASSELWSGGAARSPSSTTTSHMPRTACSAPRSRLRPCSSSTAEGRPTPG